MCHGDQPDGFDLTRIDVRVSDYGGAVNIGFLGCPVPRPRGGVIAPSLFGIVAREPKTFLITQGFSRERP